MGTYASLFVFILIVVAAASTGAFFMPGPWYDVLTKPWWTPPNWLFPIAWTILYLMIAIAGWRVWEVQGFGPAVVIWGLGIVFNAAWSWIMFGEKQIGFALADLIPMWVSVLAFILLALPLDRLAGLLFVPYLVWVTYAGALNFVIWRANP